ncbi:MAG: lysine 2,3-aminomutase [Verrucomicrobiales bacterium]|nr:lysine 2,3-aminomutase [Verrucomicrobiales bacterium]MBE87184.1 lysine 2,3-aminomutase [Verrucomicrobiales bacterium]MBP96741.1 lysine 2,3-aminomutase [Candidatus Poribacteria bacterium]|tara:strand:- start:8482 stop:9804 length:1323 start_codon:yes stop_codon:yes gene_type:complete
MTKFKPTGRPNLPQIAEKLNLSADQIIDMQAVSAVLPFRVNDYVVENLIEPTDVPDDPIFQLTFPQRGMLDEVDYRHMRDLVVSGASQNDIKIAANKIREKLNPHPAGQMELNVPKLEGEVVEGMQHKYQETVLFFPSQGQTCHAYCSYCFRWAQFVGNSDLKFASKEADNLARYVRENPQVSSVLITGGDPMVMKTSILRRYIDPLLKEDLPNLHSIRIGTKALAYWPHRFVEGEDADEFLRLIEDVKAAGKHLAIMAHSSHSRELEPDIAQLAVKRVIGAGAVIRCQAPLIRKVNDNANVWAQLWRKQVQLGMIPYYMFIERDTGAKAYFEVPLIRAFKVFNEAYNQVSGLCRTVRGPSMSASPGKVLVDGVTEVGGEKVFALKFLQGRDPSWVNRIFFAKYDSKATWLDDLKPAFGEDAFFFENPVQNKSPKTIQKP